MDGRAVCKGSVGVGWTVKGITANVLSSKASEGRAPVVFCHDVSLQELCTN